MVAKDLPCQHNDPAVDTTKQDRCLDIKAEQ